MSRPGKELRGQAEDDPRCGGEEHGDRRERNDLADRIEGVMNVPRASNIISGEGREEAGEERVVGDCADGEDFETEDRTGERRVEDGGEPALMPAMSRVRRFSRLRVSHGCG